MRDIFVFWDDFGELPLYIDWCNVSGLKPCTQASFTGRSLSIRKGAALAARSLSWIEF
jgi:hypothetical protein